MIKLLVTKAFSSPFALLAVCFALYLAAHSFFVGIFVAVVAFAWIKKSVLTKQTSEDAPKEAKAGVVAEVSMQPKAAVEPQTPTATPIRRQYAKSAVVMPLKTGTDN